MNETEDSKTFGENVYVYCSQHLRPHLTGWCSVSSREKTRLEATTIDEAFCECRKKKFALEGE